MDASIGAIQNLFQLQNQHNNVQRFEVPHHKLFYHITNIDLFNLRPYIFLISCFFLVIFMVASAWSGSLQYLFEFQRQFKEMSKSLDKI